MESVAHPLENSPNKHTGHVLSVAGWMALALFGYLLCTGPDLKLNNSSPNALFGPIFNPFCKPALYIYSYTPLHKPLGLYWRLWDPAHFDDKGQIIFYVVPD